MPSASGKPPQQARSSATAAGSAATRSSPSRLTSSARASSSVEDVQPQWPAPWRVVRRVTVPTARDDDNAGGGAGQQRHDLVGVGGVVQHEQQPLGGDGAAEQGDCPARSAGILLAAPRPARRGSPGSPPSAARARSDGEKPWRLTNSWPSGNSSTCRWAHSSASHVLPMPPAPAVMTAMPGRRSRSWSRARSSAVRPTKPPAGGAAGAAAAGGWPARSGRGRRPALRCAAPPAPGRGRCRARRPAPGGHPGTPAGPRPAGRSGTGR